MVVQNKMKILLLHSYRPWWFAVIAQNVRSFLPSLNGEAAFIRWPERATGEALAAHPIIAFNFIGNANVS